MLATDQLARYRERHTIAWVTVEGVRVCAHDGLRVVPRRPYGGASYRHDPDEIKRLVAAR